MRQTIKRKVEPKLYVSYSSFKTFKNCPEMYNQLFILPREDTEDKVPFDSYDASVGTAIQAIFEHIINKNIEYTDTDKFHKKIQDDIFTLSDMLIPIDRYSFENSKVYVDDNHIVTKFSKFAVDTSEKSLKAVRQRFILDVLKMYHKPLKKMSSLYDLSKMSSEIKMKKEYKDFTLIGTLDFVYFNEKGSIDIIDGKKQYNPAWIDDEQLRIYTLLAKHHYKLKVRKTGFWDWSSNKLINRPFTEKELLNTLESLLDFKVKLDKAKVTNKFRRKVGFHCRWCPIQEQCPNNKKETVDGLVSF